MTFGLDQAPRCGMVQEKGSCVWTGERKVWGSLHGDTPWMLLIHPLAITLSLKFKQVNLSVTMNGHFYVKDALVV